MSQYLLGFLVMALSVLGMAIGVLMGGKPIQGSCGGIASGACSGCQQSCKKKRGKTE
jgi:hypothetical protein